MAALTQAPVAIVGLGLVGGSLARALGRAGVETRGWTADPADRAAAGDAGVRVPEADTDERALAAAVADARTVVLAVPLAELPAAAGASLAAAPADALVVHVCGLQRADALGLATDAEARVLGTHPLAGSHESGFAASREHLFDGCVVSAELRATTGQRAAIQALWEAAGAARVVWRSADDHDALMAAASHLPQLVATALAATLEAQGIGVRDVGPGALDTTRLAASPHALWEGLLMRGGDDLEIALAAYQGTLAALGRAVSRRDAPAFAALWERARRWRTDAGAAG